MNSAIEAGQLTLVCYKCTRTKSFTGTDRKDCDRKALKAGWVKDGHSMICNKCPAVRWSNASLRKIG